MRDKLIRFFFFTNGMAALILVLLIFGFLLYESSAGFSKIGLDRYLSEDFVSQDGTVVTEKAWQPTSDEPKYSILPLILGTFLTAFPATIISTLLGVCTGVYISEIASSRFREVLKPIIELFAGIPTVIIGFFMLVAGATFFQEIFGYVFRLNAFIASLGISLIIIPVIASLTEDALRSVSGDIRMAAYALGANKWQAIRNVLIPAAFSGISASIILGFGRAMGETMIVLMASGSAPEFTLDVFKSVKTMTATIAAELGEVSQESPHYYALFFIGIVLFLFSFVINLTAELILSKKRRNMDY